MVGNQQYVEPEGIGGGLALWWKEGWDVTVLGKDKNLIDTRVVNKENGECFRIFWIYAPPVFDDRKRFWEEIVSKGSGINEVWMCMGDMNDIAYNFEEGGRVKEKRMLNCFRNMIDRCKLEEVDFKGPKYTWFGVMEGVVVKERLDRALVNFEWMVCFPNSQGFNELVVGSDHSPIILFSDYRDKKSPRKFRFEAAWLKEDGCSDVVKESWKYEDVCSRGPKFVYRLNKCKFNLKEWSRKKVKNN